MLDPRRLALLREVVHHGSFSGAAKALFLTQPAVSRQVAKLEREAGVRLLERTPSGLRLTDAGRVALERADAIAGHLAAAEAELEAIASLGAGRLRLCAFPTAASTLVMEAIGVFGQRHPGVELSFVEAGTRAGVQRLRAGDVDLAIVFRERGQPAPSSWDGLQAVHLLVDPLYAALAEDHPLAAKETVRLRDLRDEGFIQAVQAGPTGITYRACLAAGFEPRIAHLSDHAPITQGLVAAGLGVTLISNLSVPTSRTDLAIRPLKPAGPQRDVFALSLPGALRPPAISAMVEILRELAARYEPSRRSAGVRPSAASAS
jgi:DNA-binding transcriptional LysR family regulator